MAPGSQLSGINLTSNVPSSGDDKVDVVVVVVGGGGSLQINSADTLGKWNA